jgi:hypothetical protein
MAGIGAGVGAVGATAGSLYAGDDVGTALKKGAMTGVGAAVGMGAGALKPALGGMANSYRNASAATGVGSAFEKAGMMKRLGAKAGLMAEDFGRLAGQSSKAIYGGGAIGALGGLGYATLKSNKPVAANKQSYDERLKFEQQRKRMLVDENIRQAKQMRSGS